MTVHLKGPVRADLPATARVITDDDERALIANWIIDACLAGQDPDAMARTPR